MTYDEFTDLKILAEKKGELSLCKEMKDNSLDKNFLWGLLTALFFCLIMWLSLHFGNIKEVIDMGKLHFWISITISIICGKKLTDFMQKRNYEYNIIMRK